MEIQNDLNSYKKDKLTKTEFLKKYGHLRPGTYDITATRYDQQQQFLDNMKMFVSKKKDKRISEPKNLTSLFQKHEFKANFFNYFFDCFVSSIWKNTSNIIF